VGELVRVVRDAGLGDARIVGELDPFRGTSKERTARRHDVIGVHLLAHKSQASDA